ncbi:hypothetical protein AB0I81_24435 [Nonomuraea sp. NPDC050404]|uniref:hypothetical protein n=1 Tax=Nonomuraea sp. NPDC050404 TaxID=3155783 RepID=UPI0033F10158
MGTFSGSWRIAMDATEATLSMDTWLGPRPLYDVPEITGSFYLRPSGGLAGFALLIPLPSRALRWDAADLDRGGRSRIRLGEREIGAAVSVLCAQVPGERPYYKVVLETAFSSWRLGLPGVPRLRPRRIALTLFSEIYIVKAPG